MQNHPILVSDSCKVLDSETLYVDGFISGHKPTYVPVRINVSLSTSYYRKIWSYKNASYITFNDLKEENQRERISNFLKKCFCHATFQDGR